MEKKKISIFALHLSFGGIEKAISSLANMLCDDYQVEIISVYKICEKPVFFINENVKIKYLTNVVPNKKEFLNAVKKINILKIVKEGITALKVLLIKNKELNKAVKECNSDIIISTRWDFNKKINIQNKILVAWEHAHHNNNKKYINKLKKSVKHFDYLIPVSKALTNYYSVVIPNVKCVYMPLCIDKVPKLNSDLSKKEITFIGRLAKEKGILDLIDIFKQISLKDAETVLNIVGDGLEKESIVKKIQELNLESKIKLHGFLSGEQLEKVLLNTSICVIASFHESFGLVLLEETSYGIPCVAFDSAEGAKEIIDNNVNGYLIKNRNKEEMVNKIIQLLNNHELLSEFGKNAKKKAEDFTYENSKEKWLEFMKSV